MSEVNGAEIELATRALARRRILDFTKYTKPDYDASWFHRVYCEKIDRFIKGEIKKMMVFIPPQHGKSEISTRRLPTFMAGVFPDKKGGIVSYNAPTAIKFNKEIRRIFDDKRYLNLFPHMTVDARGEYMRNTSEIEIPNHDGSLITLGVGGGLTSRKIDYLIMDDLYKDPQSAWSKTIRDNVSDWYWAVADTRLHNDSQQLMVFTRWHEEDLAGEVLAKEGQNWEVVLFEAIKETSRADDYDIRAVGEPLWAEAHSLERLLQKKQNNPIVFESLYQQNPTPKEGLVIASSDLKRFKSEQIKDSRPDTIVAYCDIADEGDDSLCLVIGHVFDNDVYIVDVIFTKLPIEATQPLVAAKLDDMQIALAVFESNNGGKGFAQRVQELKRGMTRVEWVLTVKNKHTRIVMNSGQIKEHFRFLVDDEQSREYKDYFYELTHYPLSGKVKNDDAIDATTGLVETISRTKNRERVWI